jgi:4-hydroxy-tetrahydrodipicolinate reductase
MIKVVVSGAAGRMGCRLVSLVRDSTALMLAGALEGKGHPALGEDAGEFAGSGRAGVPITDSLSALMERGEVVIDFSSPEATLDHMRTVVHSRRSLEQPDSQLANSMNLKRLPNMCPACFLQT